MNNNMTRLRYKRVHKNILITDKLLAINEIVQVKLSIDALIAYFYFTNEQIFRYTIEANTEHKLKRLVKKELIKLGVTFSDELRGRKC